MSFIDKIILEGNISRIYDNEVDNFIWFDICKNEKYKTKQGEEQEVASFFSAKVDRNKINNNNNLFKVGSWVIITGIPKSYIDKNNYKKFYVFTLDIKSAKEKNNNNDKSSGPVITYDYDGVMLWNGKRCESTPASEEQKREMDEILKEFRGEDIDGL